MPKKSRSVPAMMLAAVAAQLVANGCGPDVSEVQQCVDQNGTVLPDQYCDNPASYTAGPTGSIFYYGGVSHVYYGRPVFVYSQSTTYIGQRASGYHMTPTDGATIHDRTGSVRGTASGGTVTRGGFSGSGGSFGG